MFTQVIEKLRQKQGFINRERSEGGRVTGKVPGARVSYSKLELGQSCPAGAKSREETISHLRSHPRWRKLWPQISPLPQSHASASHWPITECSQGHRSLGNQTAEISPLLPTIQIRVGWGSVDATGRERMVHMVNRLRTLTHKSPPNLTELWRGQGP